MLERFELEKKCSFRTVWYEAVVGFSRGDSKDANGLQYAFMVSHLWALEDIRLKEKGGIWAAARAALPYAFMQIFPHKSFFPSARGFTRWIVIIARFA